jgi:hypothetical protein
MIYESENEKKNFFSIFEKKIFDIIFLVKENKSIKKK